uniref:Uncharacterized protein n=1 Tax=Talaromyces marneffei PM1 TaxID=1077442 RepID=A0A093Y1B4_TALMA
MSESCQLIFIFVTLSLLTSRKHGLEFVRQKSDGPPLGLFMGSSNKNCALKG